MSDIQLGVDGPIPPFDTDCISLMVTKKSLREAISNLPSGRERGGNESQQVSPESSAELRFSLPVGTQHKSKEKTRAELNVKITLIDFTPVNMFLSDAQCIMSQDATS